MVNSTGVLYACVDGANHVSIIPIGGTLEEWRRQGKDSIWTQALIAVSWKLK